MQGSRDGKVRLGDALPVVNAMKKALRYSFVMAGLVMTFSFGYAYGQSRAVERSEVLECRARLLTSGALMKEATTTLHDCKICFEEKLAALREKNP